MIYSNSLHSSLYDCKSYIHNFIIIHSWVYNKPIQRSAPSWLGSSIGKSVAPILQRSRARIPYKPEFFSGFLFATAKVTSITAMIYFYIIPHPAIHINYMIFALETSSVLKRSRKERHGIVEGLKGMQHED